MDAKEKLLKAASILSSLADEIEKGFEVDASLSKLKRAGLIQTEEDAFEQKTKLSSLDSDGLKIVTQSLLDIADKAPISKSSSLGRPVMNEQNTVRTGEERWSGWHSRIMNL